MLLCPGAHKLLFVPSKSQFPQSCVSSGGSMVGLMVTSSSRAYAIPRSTALRAPALQQSTADLYLCRRHSNKVLAQSLWGLWVLVHTRFIWALQASLAGMGFDSKCYFTLLPSCWGFSFALGHGVSFFGGIQPSPVDSCSAVSCTFGVLTGDECTSFYLAIL